MAAPMQVVSPGESNIKIVKWKVKKGSMVMKGSILALYVADDKKLQLKLKSTATGIVDEIITEAGMESSPGMVLATLREQNSGGCTHPTVMKDMCADCGADLRREAEVAGDCKKAMSASVAMVHNIPELIVSQEQALEIGQEDEHRLLKTRKLVLLVDLDQTLIHTTNDNIPPKLKDVYHFQLGRGPHSCWYHMKLRPHTVEFLQHVSQMYELHICTFGVRLYAHTVARLIDPDEKFFSHRILSRDECFDPLSKTANLKALFPCGDAMVCIIDDREDVWNRAPNLVQVKPYRFFQGTADINAPPGMGKTENDDVPIVHKVIDHHGGSSEPTGDGALPDDKVLKGAGQHSGTEHGDTDHGLAGQAADGQADKDGTHTDKNEEHDGKTASTSRGEDQEAGGGPTPDQVQGDNTGESTPQTQTAGGVDEEIPASSTGQAKDITASSTEQAKDIAASSTEQAKDIPASSVGQAEDISVSSTGQTKDIPAPSTEQAEEIPVSSTEQAKDIPVSSTEQVEDIPVSSTEQADDITVPSTKQAEDQVQATDTDGVLSVDQTCSASVGVAEPSEHGADTTGAMTTTAASDLGEDPHGITAQQQLAQDLSVSSDSDSDGSDSSSSRVLEREDKEGSSVNTDVTTVVPMDTSLVESVSSDSPDKISSTPMESNTRAEASIAFVDAATPPRTSDVNLEKENHPTGNGLGQCAPSSNDEGIKENCPHADTESADCTVSHAQSTEEGESGGAALATRTGEEEAADSKDEVEWSDDDDYLLHLQEILTRIHQTFYSMVDEGRRSDPDPAPSCDADPAPSTKDTLPDLKSLIPYMKRKTLKGCNIVLSGLVPLNTSPAKSHAYLVATALGATVQSDVLGSKQAGKKGQVTSHLVAAKAGTSKHKTALRTRGVHIVSSAWLWACEERWERCDERLFPLDSEASNGDASPAPLKHKKKRHLKQKKRKLDEEDATQDTGDGDAENAGKRRKTKQDGGQPSGKTDDMASGNSASAFADTVHPLLAFSDEDLECMDKEVDELMAEDGTGSEDETDDERDQRYRDSVLGSVEDSGSSSDSLSGEFPRGWGLHRKSRSSHASEDDLDKDQQKVIEAETEETEDPLVRYQQTVETFAPDSASSSNSSFAESIGSVDDEIADAVEKEFLASL